MVQLPGVVQHGSVEIVIPAERLRLLTLCNRFSRKGCPHFIGCPGLLQCLIGDLSWFIGQTEAMCSEQPDAKIHIPLKMVLFTKFRAEDIIKVLVPSPLLVTSKRCSTRKESAYGHV